AAKVDDADADYYEQTIKPMIDGPLVEFVGEVNEDEKGAFLAGALACLLPIDWPEPFGLTMIESMATGTPVIAARCGSVGEGLEDGVSGFVCDTLPEMAAAVERVAGLDRAEVRGSAARRFSVELMGERHDQLYRRLVADWEYSSAASAPGEAEYPARWARPGG